MKELTLIFCVVFCSICSGYAASDIFSNEKLEDKEDLQLLSEKKTKLDEDNLWETTSTFLDEKQDTESLFKDDDRKLFAPPPGEEGNPQKIAPSLPLGNNDIVVLLLLSVFSISYYSYKKRYRQSN